MKLVLGFIFGALLFVLGFWTAIQMNPYNVHLVLPEPPPPGLSEWACYLNAETVTMRCASLSNTFQKLATELDKDTESL